MNRYTILLLLICIAPGTASGQTQVFGVTVPGLVSMNSVKDLAEITHDETENDQLFPWQFWTVSNLNSAGATVTFSTNRVFTHTTLPSSKRDVRLILRKWWAPRWRITQRRDTTDYSSGDETATVTAESNRAGSGIFRLGVDFIEKSFATTEGGFYEMTVIGTITPK